MQLFPNARRRRPYLDTRSPRKFRYTYAQPPASFPVLFRVSIDSTSCLRLRCLADTTVTMADGSTKPAIDGNILRKDLAVSSRTCNHNNNHNSNHNNNDNDNHSNNHNNNGGSSMVWRRWAAPAGQCRARRRKRHSVRRGAGAPGGLSLRATTAARATAMTAANDNNNDNNDDDNDDGMVSNLLRCAQKVMHYTHALHTHHVPQPRKKA
jgi:hypothetical protein